jgi:hypothetical protein
MTPADGNARYELARRGRCPDCGEEYQRLAGHWRGDCSPPALDDPTRALLTGLLLGNGRVGGNGPRKHFRLSTRWRPLAKWIYDEFNWFAARLVHLEEPREDGRGPEQRYVVRTHAHPEFGTFRAWYNHRRRSWRGRRRDRRRGERCRRR